MIRMAYCFGSSTYVDKVSQRLNLQNSKCGELPMQKGITLSLSQSLITPGVIRRMKCIQYASAIGSIMYAMICTRHDASLSLEFYESLETESK